jgi:hypothetical protein
MSASFWTLWFFGAIGHAAVWVVAINFLYGTRFRGWWVTGLRHLWEAAIPAGPLVFLIVWGPTVWDGGWGALPVPVLAYVALCWILGLVVVPLQTVRRWLRRPPALQLSNHTHRHDIAARLGYRPYGHGKRAVLARVPFNEIFQVDVVEKEFHHPALPAALDGLTILHLTDLHLCGTPDREYYEAVLAEAAREPFDILAVTGDVLDSDRHYRWILRLLSPLRWRVAAFAVLGNHDAENDVRKIERRLARLGIERLGGRWKQIGVRGEPLVVIGNETPWLTQTPDLTGCPPGPFRLGLAHSPDTLPWARRAGVHLLLAGHNHGGQVRFPGFGSVLVPSKFSRKYDCGTFYEPPTLLYVSRGLGGTYPWRFRCPPEVTRVRLHAGPGPRTS